MIKNISKEAIQELPLDQYNGDVEIIEEKEQLDSIKEELLAEKIWGVDTETRPAFKKGVSYPTALLQIATAKKVYLIRLRKTGLPEFICDIFESEDYTKIGIAVKQDFNELSGQYHYFRTKNVIDLNDWCPKLGFEKIGAKNLSAMVLGIRISKKQRVSNWESPELTEAQIRYAATDAWICREIYLRIQKETIA